MKRRQTILLLLFLSTTFALYMTFATLFKENSHNLTPQLPQEKSNVPVAKTTSRQRNRFIIAVVACGQRFQDTLIMIKSAVLFNQAKDLLHFIIFAEDSLTQQFEEKLGDWAEILKEEFSFEVRPLQFPKPLEKEWRRLFKPCASQRLFLPSLLTSVDSLLYVDTDILFLSPVSDAWSYFSRFNASQIAALTPEHENANTGWYNRFARHPYYGRLGVNSGVMLMNLTRMRSFNWETQINAIYAEYKLKLTWGDQDIINIIFYFYPEKLYLMNCPYNYRPDHCMYGSVCNVTDGIKIIHGNRGYFQSTKHPLFHSIFEAIESYQIKSDPYTEFLLPLENALSDPEVTSSKCGVVSESSMKVARKIFLRESIYNFEGLEEDKARQEA